MRFFIEEKEELQRPIYRSFFPSVYRHQKGRVEAKMVSQFEAKRSFNVYVDNTQVYNEMGGNVGAKLIEPFYDIKIPTFLDLTGLLVVEFPPLNLNTGIGIMRTDVCVGDKATDGYVVSSCIDTGKSYHLKAERLFRENSSLGLNLVTTGFCTYQKSWIKDMDLDLIEKIFYRNVKSFTNQLDEEGITNESDVHQFIKGILNPNKEDSGLVRKAKVQDYVTLLFIANKHLQGEQIKLQPVFEEAFNPNGNVAKEYEELACSMYVNVNDYHNGVYDFSFLRTEMKKLNELSSQLMCLERDHPWEKFDPKWLKNKLRDYLSKWKEFDFFWEDENQLWSWKDEEKARDDVAIFRCITHSINIYLNKNS